MPAVGGLGDPDSSFHRVGVHAAAFNQHAAIPILRVHNAFGRAAQPFGCLAVVALDADAFCKADAEVERGDQVARLGCLLEPFTGADGILFIAVPAQQQIAEIDMGTGIACLGCDAEQFRGFILVTRDTGAGQIEHAQGTRGAAVIGVHRAAEPHRGLGVVRGQIATFGVDIADQGGGFGITGQARRGAARIRLPARLRSTPLPFISAKPHRA